MGLRDSRNRDCLLFCEIPMQMARRISLQQKFRDGRQNRAP
jgi:hypothetical protein